jgi:hypothetical protein
MTGGSTIPPGCRHCRSSPGTRSSAIERCRRYPGPHALALKFDPVGVVDSAQAQCCQNPTPASPQRNPRKTYQHRHQRPPKGAGNDPVAQPSGCPAGSTETSRARRHVSAKGTPRHAGVPSVDDQDSLSPRRGNDLSPLLARFTHTKKQEHIFLTRRNAASWATSSESARSSALTLQCAGATLYLCSRGGSSERGPAIDDGQSVDLA